MAKRRIRHTFRKRQNLALVNAAYRARATLERDPHSGKPWLVERAQRLLAGRRSFLGR